MTLIACPTCKGEGHIKNPDLLADEDDFVECTSCGGSGYIDKASIIPF